MFPSPDGNGATVSAVMGARMDAPHPGLLTWDSVSPDIDDGHVALAEGAKDRSDWGAMAPSWAVSR